MQTAGNLFGVTALEAAISVLAVVVLSLVLDFSKENLRKTKKAE